MIDLAILIAGGFGTFVVLVVFVWNWDRAILSEVAGALMAPIRAGQRAGEAQATALAETVLETSIGPRRSPLRLAWYVAGATSVSLIVLGFFYFSSLGAEAVAFFSSWESVRRFSYQFLSVGFLTVFLVNYLAVGFIGPLGPRIARQGPGGVVRFLLFELLIRVVALVVVTAVLYAAYAEFGGAFGGSWEKALSAIPETLALAFRFSNLSSVYVYAALIGGFPVALVLLIKLSARYRIIADFWCRLDRLGLLTDKPVRIAGCTLGLFALVLAVIAAQLVRTGAEVAGF